MADASQEELLAQLAAMEQQMAALKQRLSAAAAEPPAQGQASGVTSGAGGVAVGGHVYGDVIYHIYQKPAGRAKLDEATFASLLQEYLTTVTTAHGKARLYGLESLRTARGRPVRSLAEVFVPITLRQFSPPSRRQIEEAARKFGRDPLAEHKAYLAVVDELRSEGQPVALSDLLTLHPRLAIIGGAGCGKSTLLAYLAASLAAHAASGVALPFQLPPGRKTLIPLLIPLRYFRQYRTEVKAAPGRSLDDPPAGLLAGFIVWYLRRRSPALEQSQDFFNRLLMGGGCLLMLDGLDEVVSKQERGWVKEEVERLASEVYPGNLILVTAREAGYRENAVLGDEFRRLDVQPLADEQIAALVGNWCRLLYPEAPEDQTQEIVTAIGEINDRYRRQKLPPLIDTPLMTTMVVSVKWGETELPRERAKLYEAAVKVILQAQYITDDETRQELVNWGGPWEEQREWLSQLALAMHTRGQNGAAIPETELRAFLQPHLPPEALDQFLAAVRSRGGLLEERSELFQFVHLTFQEFLAARLLAKQRQEAWPALLPLIEQAWWREVLLLLYGYAKMDWAAYAQQYLGWLSDLKPASADCRLAGAELAGAAVLEIERPEQEVRQEQARGLAQALVAAVAHTQPTMRLRAGKTLSALGDPRPGVLLRPDGLPDIAWVLIPKTDPQTGKGDWIYQDGKRQPEPDFWIARYPITFAQFQAFLDAPDGFGQAEWWQGLAASQADRSSPGEQRFQHWNHPRERVSWYDAIAFCRWLTAQARKTPDLLPAALQGSRDCQITLPTEWQWEKAARGHEGREYPWGQGYRSGWANVDETEKKDGPYYLQQTSAVGMYPHTAPDASPYGVADLSGNVWEWCLNEYEKPERVQPEGSELRVLRGGSWLGYPAAAASALRDSNDPYLRFDHLGFRVVLVRSSAP